MNDEGFDVIGDVHGMGDKLVELLHHMGYAEQDGAFSHPTRTVVFVGDLIDRGSQQLKALHTAKAMVDAGTAQIVMGNHEFNAIAWFDGFRERSEANRRVHEEFLDAVVEKSPEHEKWIDWFRTLPMFLDLDGLRVAHACWDDAAIGRLAKSTEQCSTAFMRRATDGQSHEYRDVETVLKGPELDIAPPYRDKGGKTRNAARFAWWRADATTMLRAAVIPGDTATLEGAPYPADAPPVLYGHYWETGQPTLQAPNATCVDYSACNDGRLVAYRWSGEEKLRQDGFCCV
jgi:hypothetical protein